MKKIILGLAMFALLLVWNPRCFAIEVSTGTSEINISTAVPNVIPDDLLSVRAYPNPWKPGSMGRQGSASKSCGVGLIIDGIVSNVRVRIYNIQADLVWEKNATALDKCVAWNGKNIFGRNVASGIYIIVVSGEKGGNIKKNVAIQR